MSSTLRVAIGASLSALILASLVGCISTASAVPSETEKSTERSTESERYPEDWYDDPPAKSPAQEELLIGGVDKADYLEGFDNYRNCLREAGFELSEIRDYGMLLDYAIPDTAVQAGAHQICYPREFAEVDRDWQVQHARS